MPQLDKYIFLPQYVWLCLLFFGLYYGALSFGLPRLLAVLKFRRLRLGVLRRSATALEGLADLHRSQLQRRLGRLGLLWTAAINLLLAAVNRRQRSAAAATEAVGRGRPLQRSAVGADLPPQWQPLPRRPLPPLPAAVALVLLRLRSHLARGELVASASGRRWRGRPHRPLALMVRSVGRP